MATPTVQVNLRLSVDDHEAIRSEASRRSLPLATFLRLAALDACARAPESRSTPAAPKQAAVKAAVARRSPVASTPPAGSPGPAVPDLELPGDDSVGPSSTTAQGPSGREAIVEDLRAKVEKLTQGGDLKANGKLGALAAEARVGVCAQAPDGSHEWLPPIHSASGVPVRECKWCRERKA